MAYQYNLSFDWGFYRAILEEEEYSNPDWVWLIGL